MTINVSNELNTFFRYDKHIGHAMKVILFPRDQIKNTWDARLQKMNGFPQREQVVAYPLVIQRSRIIGKLITVDK